MNIRFHTSYCQSPDADTLDKNLGEKGRMGLRFKVKEIAEAKKISQRQLFFRSQVDLKTIQKLFRNQTPTNITTETLDKLAMALNVDVSLLIESEPPLPKTLEES